MTCRDEDLSTLVTEHDFQVFSLVALRVFLYHRQILGEEIRHERSRSADTAGNRCNEVRWVGRRGLGYNDCRSESLLPENEQVGKQSIGRPPLLAEAQSYEPNLNEGKFEGGRISGRWKKDAKGQKNWKWRLCAERRASRWRLRGDTHGTDKYLRRRGCTTDFWIRSNDREGDQTLGYPAAILKIKNDLRSLWFGSLSCYVCPNCRRRMLGKAKQIVWQSVPSQKWRVGSSSIFNEMFIYSTQT